MHVHNIEKTASRLYRIFLQFDASIYQLWALNADDCSHKLFSLFNFNHGWVLLVPFDWIALEDENDEMAMHVWFVIGVGVCVCQLVCKCILFSRSWLFFVRFGFFLFSFAIQICIFEQFSILKYITYQWCRVGVTRKEYNEHLQPTAFHLHMNKCKKCLPSNYYEWILNIFIQTYVIITLTQL